TDVSSPGSYYIYETKIRAHSRDSETTEFITKCTSVCSNDLDDCGTLADENFSTTQFVVKFRDNNSTVAPKNCDDLSDSKLDLMKKTLCRSSGWVENKPTKDGGV